MAQLCLLHHLVHVCVTRRKCLLQTQQATTLQAQLCSMGERHTRFQTQGESGAFVEQVQHGFAMDVRRGPGAGQHFALGQRVLSHQRTDRTTRLQRTLKDAGQAIGLISCAPVGGFVHDGVSLIRKRQRRIATPEILAVRTTGLQII
jgi:hypothetical protein